MRDKRAPVAAPAVGYSLFGGGASRAERGAYLGALVVGIALACLYAIYLRSDDVAPDSGWGYAFAISGTALLALVGVGYSVRKRRARHAKGRLHTMLTWHVVGALIGLALIFMHSAGNFNPRTGTYALYGLIAATLSGVIGRLFDRVCPRLAAEADIRALTAEGADSMDRFAALQRRLPEERAFGGDTQTTRRRRQTDAPWDLAYYDLDAEGAAIPTLLAEDGPAAYALQTQRTAQSATMRLPSDAQRKRPSRLSPPHTAEADLGREQVFIGMIRAWRRLHVLLCVVAAGLLIWHIWFAITLLIAAR